MLKFQDDYTTLIATFEDFILLVYVIIDDLCYCSHPYCVLHVYTFFRCEQQHLCTQNAKEQAFWRSIPTTLMGE
ncbi:MAG: hypothetical protein K2N34_02240 [Lachnospiraceae bacterium]|nr:hypothetical protein [Lachnospiraceae bacterium]